jgi:PAS domain-containing protein
MEWRLLSGFQDMLEQVQQRMQQFMQTEQQLREKEEQYHSVFEATSNALCIVDLEGFLVEVNPAFCSLFGYTYEEIIGLHTRILTPLGYLPFLAQALETLKAGVRFEQFKTRGQYVRLANSWKRPLTTSVAGWPSHLC